MSQKAKGLDFPSQTPHPAEAELSLSLAQAQNTAERKKEKKKKENVLNVQMVRLRCLQRISNGCPTCQSRLQEEDEGSSSPPAAARDLHLHLQPPHATVNPTALQLHPHARCQSPMKRGDILRKNSKNNKAMRGCWARRGEKPRATNTAAGRRRLLGLGPVPRTHVTVQLPW